VISVHLMLWTCRWRSKACACWPILQTVTHPRSWLLTTRNASSFVFSSCLCDKKLISLFCFFHIWNFPLFFEFIFYSCNRGKVLICLLSLYRNVPGTVLMKTSSFRIKDMLKKLKTYMVHNNTNLQVIFLHVFFLQLRYSLGSFARFCSCLQCCGSKSGSVGSVCFWASWIQIRIH
jgi:hypothetical protein